MLEGISKADIESQLRHRRWLEPVPRGLRAHYTAQRQREFERLVQVWWPSLVVGFVVFIAFSLWQHSAAFTPHDLWVFWGAEVLCVALAALGLRWGFQVRRQSGFERWVACLFGLIVAARLGSSLLMAAPMLSINALHMALLVCVVGAFGLQLGVRAATVGCLLGLLGLVVLPWAPSVANAPVLVGHYLLTVLVCLFVAAIRQDKDRMAFYQSILLQLERQEVQRLNDALADLARRDSLTGLANRRAFDEALAHEWDRARRVQQPLALLMIDVDHFKAYNDHLGHPAGDACLTRLAGALTSMVRRPADLVARYGGEEFVMLLPDTDEAGARALAQRLLQAVDALDMPHPASGVGSCVTVSIGAAVARPDGFTERGHLVSRADTALYEAKNGGRHRVHLSNRLSQVPKAS